MAIPQRRPNRSLAGPAKHAPAQLSDHIVDQEGNSGVVFQRSRCMIDRNEQVIVAEAQNPNNTPCADVVVHMDGRGAVVYSDLGIPDMQRALFVACIVGNRGPVLKDIFLDALLLLRANLVTLEHCVHRISTLHTFLTCSTRNEHAQNASSSRDRLEVSGKRNHTKVISKRRKMQ